MAGIDRVNVLYCINLLTKNQWSDGRTAGVGIEGHERNHVVVCRVLLLRHADGLKGLVSAGQGLHPDVVHGAAFVEDDEIIDSGFGGVGSGVHVLRFLSVNFIRYVQIDLLGIGAQDKEGDRAKPRGVSNSLQPVHLNAGRLAICGRVDIVGSIALLDTLQDQVGISSFLVLLVKSYIDDSLVSASLKVGNIGAK